MGLFDGQMTGLTNHAIFSKMAVPSDRFDSSTVYDSERGQMQIFAGRKLRRKVITKLGPQGHL